MLANFPVFLDRVASYILPSCFLTQFICFLGSAADFGTLKLTHCALMFWFRIQFIKFTQFTFFFFRLQFQGIDLRQL